MLNKKILYSYNDVMIQPAVISEIEHRSECNVFLEDGKLPIFTAPMSTVVNEKNYDIFEKNGINAIMPRNISLDVRLDYARNGKWAAFSLSEFEQYFCNEEDNNVSQRNFKVLIDIANGHMKKMYDLVKKSKAIYGSHITIMVGNIANPNTYYELAKAGCDFVRFGVGGGSGCFVNGTQITMADGTKRNIEDIDKGDFVLTINGPQKVTNTFVKNKQETIIINNEIECTLDHKFFVVRKTDITQNITDEEIKERGFYIEAQYLCEDYLLVMV